MTHLYMKFNVHISIRRYQLTYNSPTWYSQISFVGVVTPLCQHNKHHWHKYIYIQLNSKGEYVKLYYDNSHIYNVVIVAKSLIQSIYKSM